jgi:hypothetical protein
MGDDYLLLCSARRGRCKKIYRLDPKEGIMATSCCVAPGRGDVRKITNLTLNPSVIFACLLKSPFWRRGPMGLHRENASQVCINEIYGCKTFLDVVIVECQSSSEMVCHVSDPFLWGKEREKIGG